MAGLMPTIRQYVGVSVGLSAGYLGLVSLAAHPHPGSFNRVWSLLSLGWAVALIVVARAAHNRGRQTTRSRSATA